MFPALHQQYVGDEYPRSPVLPTPTTTAALKTGTDDMAVTNDGDDFIALNRVSECPDGSTWVHSGVPGHEKTPEKQGLLMRELGLEPRTYALKGRCSTN
jgi:hypothetical protein